MEHIEPIPKTVIIGDSTLDNRVWIGKEYFNLIIGSLIPGTFRKYLTALVDFIAWLNPIKPKSVIENLRAQMPNWEFIDQTNDGFTTEDVLNGAFRDKVFGQGVHRLFPHEYFNPLDTNEIEKADHIILSIGGNDFREFILQAYNKDKVSRREYIKSEYPKVFEKTLQNYKKILAQLVKRNPHANIILMTQYYPALKQKLVLGNNIYDFMAELGKILNKGDAYDTIVEVMKDTYNGIFHFISTDPSMQNANLTVVDVTSSLNPNFSENYVGQIEPSHTGGKDIAKMLVHCLKSSENNRKIYRFAPDFFSQSANNPFVFTSNLNSKFIYNPIHPKSMLKHKYNWKKNAMILTGSLLSGGIGVVLFAYLGLSPMSSALGLGALSIAGGVCADRVVKAFSIGLQKAKNETYAFTSQKQLPKRNKTMEEFGFQAAHSWYPYLKSWLDYNAYDNDDFNEGYAKGLEDKKNATKPKN